MTTEELLKKATARPWRRGDDTKHEEPTLTNDEGRYVALLPHECVTSLLAEAEANAELIVRAVNSFEAMRGALKVAVSNAHESGEPNRVMLDHIDFVRLQQALALADGEPQ